MGKNVVVVVAIVVVVVVVNVANALRMPVKQG